MDTKETVETPDAGTATEKPATEKTFTQSELEQILKSRLARESEKAKKDAETRIASIQAELDDLKAAASGQSEKDRKLAKLQKEYELTAAERDALKKERQSLSVKAAVNAELDKHPLLPSAKKLFAELFGLKASVNGDEILVGETPLADAIAEMAGLPEYQTAPNPYGGAGTPTTSKATIINVPRTMADIQRDRDAGVFVEKLKNPDYLKAVEVLQKAAFA